MSSRAKGQKRRRTPAYFSDDAHVSHLQSLSKENQAKGKTGRPGFPLAATIFLFELIRKICELAHFRSAALPNGGYGSITGVTDTWTRRIGTQARAFTPCFSTLWKAFPGSASVPVRGETFASRGKDLSRESLFAYGQRFTSSPLRRSCGMGFSPDCPFKKRGVACPGAGEAS
jgi:hypothetical protein